MGQHQAQVPCRPCIHPVLMDLRPKQLVLRFSHQGKKMRRVLVLPLVLLFSTACYHATVDTGLPPSGQEINKPWASGWILGLVPPATINTMAECPHGVSRVETQQSFVNQLVGMLTLGIYTPMQINVRCAAAGSADAGGGPTFAADIDRSAPMEEQQEVLTEAVRQSHEAGQPLYVTVK
jgi:hypothetical protein